MAHPTERGAYGRLAEAYHRLGYVPTPLAGKRPVLDRWQEAETPPDPASFPDHNLGIVTRGLVALDCDVLDKRVALAFRRELVAMFTGTSKLLFRVGESPKWLALFRCAEGELPKRASAYYVDAHERRHRVEALRTGQQFLAAGIHPGTGKQVYWPNGSPIDRDIRTALLPEVSDEQIDRLFEIFDRLAEARSWSLISRASTAPADAVVPAPVKGVDLELARDILAAYPNDDLHYDRWLEAGMALHHQFEGSDEAFRVWREWSETSGKAADESYDYQRWQSFDPERMGGVSMRSILHHAEAHGYERPAGVEAAPASAAEFPDLGPPQLPEAAESAPEPSPAAPETDAADKPALLGAFALPDDFDPAGIPPRRWVVPGVMLRGHVTLTIGPPGVAKSIVDLTRAIAIVTGRELLGERIAKRGPVILINNEDPRDEIERRVAAIALHYGIHFAELADLHLVSGYAAPIKLAELHGDRHSAYLRPTKDASRLLKLAESTQAAAIIVDPLISTVRGGEENSNDRMEELVTIYKRIAGRTDTAVAITHHTKKVGRDSEAHAGDMETARGGSALVGAVRIAFTLAKMAAASGQERGLPRAVSKRLIRLDDAKQNYWMSDDEARWCYLESVALGNGETAGVPLPTTLEAIAEEHGADTSMTVEHLTADAKRTMLVQLLAPDMTDGLYAAPISAVSERWCAHAEVGTRQAREQLKQLIPEGGSGQAITITLHGVGYKLWRTITGEAKSSRQTVYMQRDNTDNAWLN